MYIDIFIYKYIIHLLFFSLSNIAVGTVFMLGSMLLGGFYVKNLPPGLAWLKYLVSTNLFGISFSNFNTFFQILIHFFFPSECH